MSGPKVHSYRVTSAEEMRRREDIARRAKCELLASKCRRESYKLDSPSLISVPTLTDGSHEALLEWESKLNAALKEIVLQLDKENAKRVVKRLRANAPELNVAGVTLGRNKAAQLSNTQSQDNFIEREISSLAPQIGRVRDQKQAIELMEMTERLIKYSDEALARGDLLTLKSRLNDLLSMQDLNDLADLEIARIAHVAGSKAEAIRQDAKEVSTKEELDAIKHRVSELLAAEEAKQDEAFVAKALKEVLSDLGFEVGGGFEVTDFGKVAIAESAEYPGYALRVQVNPKNGMLFTRLVALEAHGLDEDASIEQASCDSIKSLREHLQRKGIEAELVSERMPGERPVELLDGVTVASWVARRNRRDAGRVMSNAR